MNESLSYNTTVAFIDVAGSSKLYKEIGNDEAIRRIGNVVQQVCDIAKAHHGVVIKTIGDEVMCHFLDTDNACEATISMQQSGVLTLPLRIGLAWGHVIEKDNDIFGEAVNDAAAVEKISRARQIITTDAFRQKLSASNAEKLFQYDEVKLKGGQQRTKLYRIEWESDTATKTGSQQTVIMPVFGAVQQQLVISFQAPNGKTEAITLTSTNNVPLHIGRDKDSCQLAIDSPQASRDHCHIDYQYGKFMLLDHSTNGTYVKSTEDTPVYLRRQGVPLLGAGEISLGELVSDDSPYVIRFSG